jgi:CheY-like chemotaxis protein/two-component sensor histidine kinase
MQLISDVLDLSKIEAGEMHTHIEDIYLEDLMDEIAITTEGLLADKTTTFTCDYPNEVPVIQNDYIKLKQILNNLVSNAIKFTTEGGVSLNVSLLHDPSSNWGIRVEVRDTGCGIPEDKLPGIFESFKQVDESIKKKFGGTGLGLAITKKFCDSLGIDIGVSSEVDKGTTFWLNIPFAYRGISGALPSERIAQPSALDVQLFFPEPEQKALMLCLSSVEICDTLRQHIGRVPLEVQQVATKEECLEHAEQSLIWTVLMESGADEFETVAHALKDEALFAQVPLMLYGSDEKGDNVWPSGSIEYFADPIEAPQLLSALFRITQQQLGKPATSQTILIVDDNQMNLELEASIFRGAGYTVYTAESGEAGIEQASETLPDIILMDLAMPGMDGFEATQRILQQPATADIVIIACSAFATKDHQIRAAEAGCKGYITKPVDPNRLVEQTTTYFLTAKIGQQIEQFGQA